MGQIILHKQGAYQLYSTISDGPCYETALTLDELKEVLRHEGGQRAIDELPPRLVRAHITGCSGYNNTLLGCITMNRAGPDGQRVSPEEFIQRWLTLPAKDTP